MDPVLNPFAPGAGSTPPELAGRDDLLAQAKVVIERVGSGRPARGMILLGLRGVGKTVLLNEIDRMATESGKNVCLYFEAPEKRSLAEILVPALRKALLRLSQKDRAAGDTDDDLADLVTAVAEAGKEEQASIILIIDELQHLDAGELSALNAAMHRVEQKGLPVLLFGAGLPPSIALAGVTTLHEIGPLDPAAARDAIGYPLLREGVAITERALDFILERTAGYPYFLQEWGYHVWNTAATSPITEADARRADVAALTQLDRSFFRARFDRLTPREQDYMRAMAELGPGPHGSGAIAGVLSQPGPAVAAMRQGLVVKGMIYSPRRGETAFTGPMFDGFLRRAMPDWRPPPPPPRRTTRGRPPRDERSL